MTRECLNCQACGDLLFVKTTRKSCTVKCGRCHYAKNLPAIKAATQPLALLAWHRQTGHVCAYCDASTSPDVRCANCLFDPASGERSYS